MVDSLSLRAAVTFIAPSAPAAPAAPVVEFAVPPPPAALAAGGVIAATVVGQDGNNVLLLRTDFGTLAIKTTLTLPPGTLVELKLFAGPPAGAAILSADGAPIGFGALRSLPGAAVPTGAPPSASAQAAAQTPAAPSESIQVGQSVRATVVVAATTPGAPPSGSELTLRVLPLPTAGAPAGASTPILGTILQSGGAITLADAAGLGRLALDARIDLPPGTQFALDNLGAPARAAKAAAQAPASPTAGGGWPALDDALATLDKTAPNLAAQLRADFAPGEAPRLAAALLFFMGVLKGNGMWPGDQVGAALTGAGRADLRARLAKDVSDLRQQSAASANGDWRVFTLPVLDEAAVRPIRLYVRNPQDDGQGGKRDPQGSRFVLDLDLSRFGPLQLDGLVRSGRFDLVLRSHEAIDPTMRAEMSALFHTSMDGSGFSGDIAFVITPQFPVAPLQTARPHLGIQI